MNCTTHHRACDCREAAHAAEVERLTQERDKFRHALEGSQDFHAAIRQTCLARGFDGTWSDDAVRALAEAYDARGAEVESLRGALSSQDDRLRAAGLRVDVYFGCDTADAMAETIESLRTTLAEVRAYAHGVAVSTSDTVAEMVARRILALLPREHNNGGSR